MKTLKLNLIGLPVLFSLLAFNSCTKEEFINDELQNLQTKTVSAIATNVTMKVTCLTNRNLEPGNSFVHRIALFNGLTPIANGVIGIEDPLRQVSTIITTNSSGQATWYSTTSLTTPRNAYTIKFMYGSMANYSTVCINPTPFSYINLPSCKIDFISSTTLSNSTLVLCNRSNFQSTTQPQSTTLQQALIVGKAIKDEYLKNPGNQIMITVAAATCTYGAVIPGAGWAACAVSVKLVALEFTQTAVKYFFKQAIDKTSLPTATKTTLKEIIDKGSAAYSFLTFDPQNAIKVLSYLPSIATLTNTSSAQIFYAGSGVTNGATFSLALQGTDEIINFSMIKRQ